MEYAAESKNAEVAEELLAYFLEKKAYDCFAACLFQVEIRLYISVHDHSKCSWLRNNIVGWNQLYFGIRKE